LGGSDAGQSSASWLKFQGDNKREVTCDATGAVLKRLRQINLYDDFMPIALPRFFLTERHTRALGYDKGLLPINGRQGALSMKGPLTMNIHRPVCTFLLVLLLSYVCVAQRAAAVSTSDASDIYWTPSESGWGIQFVEQDSTIFATMYVYGPDGKPTWYSATLTIEEFPTFTGTLYATTGPWFGTVPFDPTQVTRTPVGTMTFNGSDVRFGSLVYTVNGLQVNKQIQRVTFATENFAGAYIGTLRQQGLANGVPCNPPVSNPGIPTNFQITQNGAAMTIVAQTSADTCTFPGTFGQSGHFGDVVGNYTCASGDQGTFQFFEMAASFYDFRARTLVRSASGCTINGFADGLRQ
jgi:hypothetical protein